MTAPMLAFDAIYVPPLPIVNPVVRSGELPLSEAIAIMEEMLAALVTLTIPGQRETMRKIATFVEGQVGRIGRARGAVNARTLKGLAAALARDCAPALPDVAAFEERARGVFGVLRTMA